MKVKIKKKHHYNLKMENVNRCPGGTG